MWTGVCRKNPATLGIITQTLHLWCAKHSSSIWCAWNQIQLVFICRMLCTSFILAFGEKGIEFAKLLYKTEFYLSRIYSVSAFCIVWVILKPVSTTETQDAGIWPKHSVIPSTQDDQSVAFPLWKRKGERDWDSLCRWRVGSMSPWEGRWLMLGI